ncbi:MAG: ABC transporter ATP-binding protein [Bacteroidaceae bacterium]|nr:ABC transporter ATP-binding protein [Bacteroidaceae bacterium]MBR1467574.1 ABC transporter ATP-binding protein [Bacteroidaceae bacterium]
MIQINNIRKTFGPKTAVDIDDFTILQGQMLGLVGNNGAGKSTLFRLLLDLIEPDKDQKDKPRIVNCGVEVNATEEWKDWTGAFLDESFLIDYLTPDEYLHFVSQISNIDPEGEKQLVEESSHFLSGEILGQKKLIRNLSAGQKQKLGILSAMASRPRILILDEPFNFLDPTSQNALKALLTDYNRKSGATILISSHNLQHTIEICPRIALMENGRIIRDIDNTTGSALQELEEYFA